MSEYLNYKQKDLIKVMVEGVFGEEAANDLDIVASYEDAFVESNIWLIERYLEYSQRAISAEDFIMSLKYPSTFLGKLNFLNIGLRKRCLKFLKDIKYIDER